MKRLLFALAMVASLAGCDDKDTNLVNDGDGGNNPLADGGGLADGNFVDFSDADPLAPDAGPAVPCGDDQPQCNNCIDDDGDDKADGADPECSGAIDNDESSFATGIPGDNVDPKSQDCFFDGNSGGGDDKCKYHTCCILDLTQQPDGKCPANLQPPMFNPSQCVLSAECINNCAPLTPPGCDCFGCCTICDGDNCRDIYTNPAVSVGCTLETLDDPSKCMECTKTEECSGGSCDNSNCELCPGQTTEDLPPECGETQACPDGHDVCVVGEGGCPAGEYCSNGCCIASIG
jgi:hypothetical protein